MAVVAALLQLLLLLPHVLTPLGPGASPARGVWPLHPRPELSESFHPPASRYGSGHRGVDLVGHPGQPVHSPLAGTVRFAGLLAGRGVVVVDHGDTRTTYEPVHATVHLGEQVAVDSVIGRLQASPSHCAPRTCLHWGLIRGDTYLDPLALVGGGPVRLLPLTGPVLPAGPGATAAAWLGAPVASRAAAPPGRPPASLVRTTPPWADASGRRPHRVDVGRRHAGGPMVDGWPRSRFARPL